MIRLLSFALVAICLNHVIAAYPGSYYRARENKKAVASSYSQYINYHEAAPYKEYDDEPAAPAKMAEAAGEGAQPMEAAVMMMAAEGEQQNQGEGNNGGAMGGKPYRGGQKYRGSYSYMSQGNGKEAGGGGEAGGMQEMMQAGMQEMMQGKMQEEMQGGMGGGMEEENAGMMAGGEGNGMQAGNQGGEGETANQGGGEEGAGEEEEEGYEPEYVYVLHTVASPIKFGGYGLKTQLSKKGFGGLRFGYRSKGRQSYSYSMRKEAAGAGGEQAGGAMPAMGDGNMQEMQGGAEGMMMEEMQGNAGGMMMEEGAGQEQMMGGAGMMAEQQGGNIMAKQMGRMMRGKHRYYVREPYVEAGRKGGMVQMEGGMAQNEGGGMMQVQQGMAEMGEGMAAAGKEGMEQMQGGMIQEEQSEMMAGNEGGGAEGEEEMGAGGGGKENQFLSGFFGGKNGGIKGGFDLGLGQAGMGEFKREFYAPAYYLFRYGVEDHKTGDFKKHHEVRDKDGTRGFYSLVEPDGTIRVVRYRASKNSGFNAVVETRGRSKHPSSK